MSRLTFAAATCLATALLAAPARAQAPDDLDAGAPPPGPAGDRKTWASCIENVPEGALRPELVESFPDRGLSGYAAPLEVTVKHGKGETVLAAGFRVQAASDAARALALAGFTLPDQDGGSPAKIEREETDTGAVTKVTIPFVPLPKEAGRNDMVLPPVPITITRASGSLVTICTKAHPIRVEDPTANESEPKVKPNPPPRPQREEWVLAKNVAMGALAGAVAMALTAWLVLRWRRRPKVVKLPPPKLPWVVALEELEAIRRSDLLASAGDEPGSAADGAPVGRNAEYFDRVSDCVRKYLGARYGFDGLETTTDEMRGLLERVRPPIPRLREITSFLEDCDLVKFARVVPSEEDCLGALARGETIVHMTIPPVVAGTPGAREAA